MTLGDQADSIHRKIQSTCSASFRGSVRQAVLLLEQVGVAVLSKSKDCTCNTGSGKSAWAIFCILPFLHQHRTGQSLMSALAMRAFHVPNGGVSDKAKAQLGQLLVA